MIFFLYLLSRKCKFVLYKCCVSVHGGYRYWNNIKHKLFTVDAVALNCVYLQRHLVFLRFYSSDLLFWMLVVVIIFSMVRYEKCVAKLVVIVQNFLMYFVLWKQASLLIWVFGFFFLYCLTSVNLPHFYSIRCLFACGKVAKYIIHLQQVKVGCRGICWHTVGTNLSR